MAKTEKDTQLVHMRLESELLKRLDDFRFKHRFQTRTETARWLIDWALKQKPTPEGEVGGARKRVSMSLWGRRPYGRPGQARGFRRRYPRAPHEHFEPTREITVLGRCRRRPRKKVTIARLDQWDNSCGMRVSHDGVLSPKKT